jgi:single-strand DNA-binding protein
MQNYTAATIEGFVTHEPVLRTTKTGKAVCTFSVAINHYASPDSSPKVSFLDVETWEKLADLCSKNVAKGKKVMVIGTLRQDRWEGKDGKNQSKIKMVGNQIRFIDTKKDVKEEARDDIQ